MLCLLRINVHQSLVEIGVKSLGPKMFGVGDFWLSLTRLFYGIFQGAFERISEILMTNF